LRMTTSKFIYLLVVGKVREVKNFASNPR